MTQLRKVGFPYTRITSASLKHLAGMGSGLEHLDLSGTDVGDEGFAATYELPHLQTLELRHSRVSDSALRPLKALRPDLVIKRD